MASERGEWLLLGIFLPWVFVVGGVGPSGRGSKFTIIPMHRGKVMLHPLSILGLTDLLLS